MVEPCGKVSGCGWRGKPGSRGGAEGGEFWGLLQVPTETRSEKTRGEAHFSLVMFSFCSTNVYG